MGKVYKAQLRCDAATRRVSRLVCDQFGYVDAQAQVSEGGRRGMKVSVTLPAAGAASLPAVHGVLAAYLFEAQVTAA